MSEDMMLDPQTDNEKLFKRVQDAMMDASWHSTLETPNPKHAGLRGVDRSTHCLMEALARQGIALRSLADGE